MVFYTVAGPFIGIEPYLKGTAKLDAQTCQFQLSGGMDFQLAFKVAILGANLADFNKTVLGPTGQLAQLNLCQPVIFLAPTSVRFTAVQGDEGNPSPKSVSISNGGRGTLSGLQLGTGIPASSPFCTACRASA